MPDPFPYSESVLQLIWHKSLFSTHRLQTTDGQRVGILNPGILNSTDGPDFSQASVIIDDIEWHGSVELHLRSSGWIQHRHHLDENYNNVILHVVAEDAPKPVYTASGNSIPTLNLLPYLTDETRGFLLNMSDTATLPCIKNLSFISPDALEAQMYKAHQQYFEKKLEDILSFYDPAEPPMLAWKKALTLSVFDGFGIPHNRVAMTEAGRFMTSRYISGSKVSLKVLKDHSFRDPDVSARWNYRGVHPVSHPANSLKYAWKIAEQVLSVNEKAVLTASDPLQLWALWAEKAGISHHYKSRILQATVFLPSLYLLGSLFHSDELMKKADTAWAEYRISIPKSIQYELRAFGENNTKKYKKLLGSVHQLRSYCKPRKCHECEVLKKVISS